MKLINKKAIVTGAASGIGKETVIQMLNEGARVCASDINEEGLVALLDEVGKPERELCYRVADVSNPKDCEGLVDYACERLGGIDILFSNAGVSGQRELVGDISDESWKLVLDINLSGVFYTNREAIRKMGRGGVIVNNASVDGLVGMGRLGHYTAAKHGVIGLTKSVALDHAKDGIRCVAIAPGYIDTGMTQSAFSEQEKAAIIGASPLKKAACPSEVAKVVAWIASSDASYVTGSTIVIDGGLLAGFSM